MVLKILQPRDDFKKKNETIRITAANSDTPITRISICDEDGSSVATGNMTNVSGTDFWYYDFTPSSSGTYFITINDGAGNEDYSSIEVVDSDDYYALKSDVSSVETKVDNIKAQTDKLQFDSNNYVKANVQDKGVLNDISASDVWSYSTRTITGGTIDTVNDKTGYSLTSSDKDDIADRVWDEPVSDHTTTGTFGEKNQNKVPSEDVNDYKADTSGLATSSQVQNVLNEVQAHRNEVEPELDSIKSQTDKMQFDASNYIKANVQNKGVLNDISASDVWNYSTRSLTSPVNINMSQSLPSSPSANTVGSSLKKSEEKLDAKISSRSSHSPADVWSYTTRTITGGTIDTVNDKTGYEIAGTKTRLDDLNDISASEVKAQCKSALEDHRLDELVSTSANKPAIGSLFDQIMNKDSNQTFDQSTDSLEAISESGGGGGSCSPEDIWTYPNRSLTEPVDINMNQSLPSSPSANTTGSALSKSENNLDATVSSRASQSSVDSVKSDTGQIKAQTDKLQFDANNNVKANVQDKGVLNDISADDVWSYSTRTLTSPVEIDMSQTLPASPSANTVGSSLKKSEDNLDVKVSTRSSHSPSDVWSHSSRTITGGTIDTVNDKTGYEIAGTKTRLDDLNDVSASEVKNQCKSALEDYRLDELVHSSAGGVKPAVGSFFDQIMNKDANQTFDPATDSLEAISDSGGSGITAEDVWTYPNRSLTEPVDINMEQEIPDSPSADTTGSALRHCEDRLDVKVSSRSHHDVVDVWSWMNRTITGGTIDTVNDKTGYSLTEDDKKDIADKVWDEPISDHTTTGTFGEKNQNKVPSENVDDYKADTSGLATSSEVQSVLNEVQAHRNEVEPELDSIKSQTDKMQFDANNYIKSNAQNSELANLDAPVSSRASSSELTAHDTDIKNELAEIQGTGFDYTSHSLVKIKEKIDEVDSDLASHDSDVMTELQNIRNKTDKLQFDANNYVKANVQDKGVLNDISASDVWNYSTRTITGGVIDQNNDKTGYEIAGTKTRLDDLNDISASEVKSQCKSALADYRLDELVYDSANNVKPAIGSFFDQIMNKDSNQTFDQSTDSLEALSDSSSGGITAEDVWTYPERSLTEPVDINMEQNLPATPTSGTTGSALSKSENNLDATISSRASESSLSSHDSDVKSELSDIKAQTDKLQFDSNNYVKANVQDKGVLNDISASDVWSYTTRTITGGTIDQNNDKTGYSLTSSEKDEIADRVWDEPVSEHTTQGTFGEKNQNKVPSEDVDDYKADVSGLATSSEVQNILNEVQSHRNEAEPELDSIKSKTDKMQFDTLNYILSRVKINEDKSDYKLTDTEKNEIADRVWDEPTSGHTSSGTFGLELQQIRPEISQHDSNVSSLLNEIKAKTDTINWSDIFTMKEVLLGRWKIDYDDSLLIYYGQDNTTEIARFELYDETGQKNPERVFERKRV